MIKAKKSAGADFTPMDEGSYVARIYQILHIGTVAGYQGALQNKVRISFEFPTELKVFKEENGEQPLSLSQDYTLSFHEKATLTKVINACDPKALKVGDDGFMDEYDIEKLLGKSCLVTVIHKAGKEGKVFANIGNCTVLPKGMVCPPAMNPPKVLNYDNFDKEYFMSLPTFIQDKIRSSQEYRTVVLGETQDTIMETNPFDDDGITDHEDQL